MPTNNPFGDMAGYIGSSIDVYYLVELVSSVIYSTVIAVD